LASFMRKGFVLAALALLAGCALPFGGGSSSSNNSNSTSSAPSVGPGIAATRTENKEFWFSGYHVTLGDAKYALALTPTPGGTPKQAQLTVAAKFENLGPDTATFFATMSVVSNSQSYTTRGDDEKLPAIPGKSTTSGVIAFTVDDKFNLDDAVLTVGDASTNQAVVPLGSKGTLVSLQPRSLPLAGAITQAGEYSLNVTGGSLSFDNPDGHRTEDAGMALLVIKFSITGTGDHGCCIGTTEWSLKIPDGTAVPADTQVLDGGIPPKGTTKSGASVEFLVKLPAEGAYDAIVKSVNTTGQSGDLAFTVTAVGSGGSAPGTTQGSPGATPGSTPSSH
jgi:hypothetical protein